MFSWTIYGIHQKGARPKTYSQVEVPEMSPQKDHKINRQMPTHTALTDFPDSRPPHPQMQTERLAHYPATKVH
ncbi:hypothetical protein Hdeb2414_s0033g00722061 [Helianthus debilis subsp. tardiflorus]